MIPNITKRVSESELKVKFAEVDSYKIAHHSSYITWFEDAWISHMYMYDPFVDTAKKDWQLTSEIRDINCKFHKATRYGDLLCLRTKVIDFIIGDEVLVNFRQVIVHQKSNEKVAVCNVVVKFDIS